MPEPALHFAVPFALMAPVLGPRKAALVSLVSLIPDLDALFSVHRSVTHSFVLLLLVSLIAVGLTIRLKPRQLRLVSCGVLSLLIHPIMDVFDTQSPFLWPVVGEPIYLNLRWVLPVNRVGYPILTGEGFVVSLLLVTIPLLTYSRHKYTH